jgi:N-acetylmuramoyl-L-alanine amidase
MMDNPKVFIDIDHPIHTHTYKLNGKLSYRKRTTEIILHCAATREGRDYSVDAIDRWHKERKFTCIGYQYVIYRDGSIHEGRPERAVGGHCFNHNSISIGICYIGGCKDDSKLTPKDTRTPEQKESMFLLVRYLLNKYGLTLDNVYCHNQWAKKACPSFKIETFKKEYKEYFENSDEIKN